MDQSQNSTNSASTTLDKPQSFSQDKRDHWSPIIKAWHDSGLSQSAFCRKNNLNRPQFTYWRTKILSKTDGPRHSSTTQRDASSFVPVEAFDSQSNTGLRVSLPNGVILSGINEHNVALLKMIVQAL